MALIKHNLKDLNHSGIDLVNCRDELGVTKALVVAQIGEH